MVKMKKVYIVMWDNNSEYNEYDRDFWGIYSSLENALKSIPEHCEYASECDNFWIESCELDGTKCCVEVRSKSVEEWRKELM
jgi:hypothetical protein